MAGTVIGVRSTLRELRKTDEKLYWATVNRMKAAAKPLATAIDGNFPAGPPLSGFDHNGRTGWRQRKTTTIKVGGKRNATGWPLIRIFIADAPRMIFDMAGEGSLGANLSGRWGRPSRAVWRTSDALRRQVTDDVEAAIRQESRAISGTIARVR
jgi:hypothetical protein